MSAPLELAVLGDLRPENLRRIDFEYHVQTIASNSQEILGIQQQAFKLQLGQSVVALQQLDQQRQTNTALHAIGAELSNISSGISALHAESQQTRAAIESVALSLDGISDQLYRQQQELGTIAEILREPYETKAKELRDQADKWLSVGMKRSGRDRSEDFKDAMQLLEATIANPIGKQDYVAWFQIGWLFWRDGGRLAEAEEAFYRSQRLSEPEGDEWFIKAVRHLAHMQYLQGKYGDAVATIEKATSLKESLPPAANPEAAFEAARYYARTGDSRMMLVELEWAVRHSPALILTMYAEDDFSDYTDALVALHQKLATEAADNVAVRLANAQAVLGIAKEELRSGVLEYIIPVSAINIINQETVSHDRFDFLGHLDAESRVDAAASEIFATVEGAKMLHLERIDHEVQDTLRQIGSKRAAKEIRVQYGSPDSDAGLIEKLVKSAKVSSLKHELVALNAQEESVLLGFHMMTEKVLNAANALLAKLHEHKLSPPVIPRVQLEPASASRDRGKSATSFRSPWDE